MVTEIIKNLRYYTSTDLKTLKSMNATSQVCSKQPVQMAPLSIDETTAPSGSVILKY